MYFFEKVVSLFTSKSDMNKYLIIGIGNIGDDYVNTRHNIGFDVLDKLSDILNVNFESVKLALRAESKFKGKKIILIKPNNYVNNSGKSFLYCKNKEKVSNDNILVVCDDLNLYFGNIKIKSSGTAGGHNGLKDIQEFLGTSNYPRIRVGISNNTKTSMTDYVLGKWTDSEQENINNLVKVSTDIIFSFIQTGIERTMNFYNKKNFIDENL
jgi:PTH1 family peptidyl-tRNA hydrolase